MTNVVKRLIVSTFALVSVVAMTGVASAYNQAEYTANGKPQFNAYTDVENFGNEKDFFRVGPVDGKGSQFSNEFELCKGEAQLNVYIHNGAPEGFNGENNNGTGVAKNTKLNVKIPEGKNKNFPMTAVVSASNATTVTDGARVFCNGHEVKLEYVKGSATIQSLKRSKAQLSDVVVNGGTIIGTYADDGVVPGCWEFRVYVTLKVRVVKVEKPVVPPVTPPVTPTPEKPTPNELPNTGMGNIAGIVTATTAAGTVAHRVVLSRRRK